MSRGSANLRRWVECIVFRPEYAVISGNPVRFYDENDGLYKSEPSVFEDGKLYTWDEVRDYLNYDFEPGLGVVGCHAITVWGESQIGFVSQYDGSTSFHVIPRNPTAYIPEMPGG